MALSRDSFRLPCILYAGLPDRRAEVVPGVCTSFAHPTVSDPVARRRRTLPLPQGSVVHVPAFVGDRRSGSGIPRTRGIRGYMRLKHGKRLLFFFSSSFSIPQESRALVFPLLPPTWRSGYPQGQRLGVWEAVTGSHPARCASLGYHISGLGQGYPTTQEREGRFCFSPFLLRSYTGRQLNRSGKFAVSTEKRIKKRREDHPRQSSSGVTSCEITRHGGPRTCQIHLSRILW